MHVAIVDYGSGNLRSAQKAFERMVHERNLSHDVLVTDQPETVLKAERVVLPGVGAFADCRSGLDGVPGMVSALNEAVMDMGKPFLGICVGHQLMAEKGLEKQATPGLGWIAGDCVHMEPDDADLKLPQIGWNTLKSVRPHPVLKNIPMGDDGWHAYFVHSYHVACTKSEDVLATSDYGGTLTAMVARDNLIGTQFHPEKSQKLGLTLIGNFLEWTP